jgi:hypothetical protein
MNVDDAQPKLLHELYGEKEQPWSEKSEPIIRFWESESGECWGLPFFSLSAARLVPHSHPYSQRLILYFPLATIWVTGGPKVLEFYEAFAKQTATLLKADGKDILSVKVALNGEKESPERI